MTKLSLQTRQLSIQHSLIDLIHRPCLPCSESHSLTDRLVLCYCDGMWSDILMDSHVLPYFNLDHSHALCSLTEHSNFDDPLEERLLQLTVLATLLSVYVQVNFTGPLFPLAPIELFPSSNLNEDLLNSASLERLSLAGVPAYHLAKSATFLLLAIQMLDRLQSSQSAPESSDALLTLPDTTVWWRLRAGVLQRRLLDEPVAFPDGLLANLDRFSHQHLVPLNNLQLPSCHSEWDRDLLPMLTLERGLMEHISGNEKAANMMFRKAVGQARLEYELTGVLGKRTKFQENEISQLVVLAKGRQRSSTNKDSNGLQPSCDPTLPAVVPLPTMPVTLGLNDDTLLEKTHFTQTTHSPLALDPAAQPALHPLDQAILLALSLSIKNTSPSHGLTKAQMSPFIERVLENAANWSVHSMALLVRSRLESHRTRTVERGLLQLQALVDQLTKEAENDPVDKATALERVRWTWALALPSKWELERELAQKLTGMGVTRSAMEIFERLEMWEHVVQCHLSLGTKERGIELVKDLIAGRKIESHLRITRQRYPSDGKRLGKLWCLLAELEGDPAHWETAWEVSQHTSSRSMRSLGAHHFAQGNYVKAKECLSLALMINPLFSRTWFVYGCAAMRTLDWEEAEVAFRRCVSLDDEDAEAWNNLATVHLKQASRDGEKQVGGESEPAVVPLLADDDSKSTNEADNEASISARLVAAFYALQQAVKLSYDSWRMWTNYMIVAISVRKYMEAIRAFGRVIEIRADEGLDEAALQSLVAAATAKPDESCEGERGDRLFERLEEVMDRVVLVKCPNDFRVWEARGALREAVADYKSTIEHQLTAYRVGVSQRGEDWVCSVEGWEKAALLVKRTVEKLARLGPQLGTEEQARVKWRWQCKSLLRSFLSKSRDGFEDQKLFVELESRVEEFK